ncbi:MAG: hypothetical protein NTW61_02585 [Candidatus Melainabacteria bacterium]|nr:hypothetical protein [Candidatus Melainabacteria bacterium]
MKFLTLSKLTLAFALVVTAVLSTANNANAEDQAFLSVFSPITGQTIQQGYSSAPTISYIQKQVVAYDLRLEQLLSMPIGIQREVLSLDGVQRPLTREERHAIVAFRSVVPTEVINSVVHSNYISEGTLALYGVTIPNNISKLPDGYKCVLLGNRVLFVNQANSVISSVAL